MIERKRIFETKYNFILELPNAGDVIEKRIPDSDHYHYVFAAHAFARRNKIKVSTTRNRRKGTTIVKRLT